MGRITILSVKKAEKSTAPRAHWAAMLDAHVKATGQKWPEIAEKLGLSDPALRHWRNGTRDVGLMDFLRLCNATKADPCELIASEKDEFKRQLLFFYNRIRTQEKRDELVGTANRLYVQDNPGPSPGNPFGALSPGKPPQQPTPSAAKPRQGARR